ncbi:MAG: CPBP family glutamic-type intramembrane protease, partial [Planctomycetota bacterium]
MNTRGDDSRLRCPRLRGLVVLATLRHLSVGTSYYAVWLLTLLFAPAALIGLLRGPAPQSWRVTQTWLPALGLALTFWALLAANGLATVAAVIVDTWFSKAWEGPSYHLFSNLFYLLIQAGPVIIISWFLLPTGRSFRRVFGLGFSHLWNAKNLAIVLGFYGIYGFLSFGFYEFEKWLGTSDTRDFLDPGLIDSGQLGLISQIVLAAVIAPLFEELLFRGFLYTSLRSRTN